MSSYVDYVIPAEPVEEGQTNMVTIVFKPQIQSKFITDTGNIYLYIYLTGELYTIFEKNFTINVTGLTLKVPSMICWSDYISTDRVATYRPLLYGNSNINIIDIVNNDDRTQHKMIKVHNCDPYPELSVIEFHQIIDHVYFIPCHCEYIDSLHRNYRYDMIDDCFQEEEGKLSIFKPDVRFRNESDGTHEDVFVEINYRTFVNTYVQFDNNNLARNEILLIRSGVVPSWVYQQLLPITDKYVYDVKEGDSENPIYYITFGTLEDIQNKEITHYYKLIGFNKIIKKAESRPLFST